MSTPYQQAEVDKHEKRNMEHYDNRRLAARRLWDDITRAAKEADTRWRLELALDRLQRESR